MAQDAQATELLSYGETRAGPSLAATGEFWVTDHGPQGGDEIDIVRAGKNYGWPDVSYGTQYDFQRTDGRKNVPAGNGKTSMPGVEEPAYFWFPDIAPSGMLFYTRRENFPNGREISSSAAWQRKRWCAWCSTATASWAKSIC